jgi:hypothetical protein
MGFLGESIGGAPDELDTLLAAPFEKYTIEDAEFLVSAD